MDRYMEFVQRRQTFFHTVRQMIRCGGQCHHGRAHDQKCQPDRHKGGLFYTFHRKGQLPDPDKRRSRREEHIKDHSDQKQYHDRLQTFYHKAERHFGSLDHNGQENSCHQIHQKRTVQKQRNDKGQCSDQLHSGIQPMDHGFCRIILSDGDITDHKAAPFPGSVFSDTVFFNGRFRAFNIAFFASSTVVASVSISQPFSFNAWVT